MIGMLRNLISRAVVKRVDASTKIQTIQVEVLAGEIRDQIEHFEPFGFSSHPPPGAEAIILDVGGAADHSVAVVVADRRYRPTDLAQGESAIHDDSGNELKIGASGVETNCDVDVDGDVIASGNYRRGADAGISGNLVVTLAAPNVGVLNVTISGGIVTNMAGAGVFVWTAAP